MGDENSLFRGNKVDVVHISDFLQLDVPVTQLFGGQVHPVSLVRYIMVLAEDAAEVAHASVRGFVVSL